jgi:TDG/mug DNA glycosylase family protein
VNPGLWTAVVNAPFARPGNRFWPALEAGGVLPRRVDASRGLRTADRELLLSRGVGITNLVNRATARADELSREELRQGARDLQQVVRYTHPRLIAVAGIVAYREAFEDPHAVQGPQPRELCGVPLWVLPNPSGLNAHETVASLGLAFGRAAAAAGLVLSAP